MCGNKSTPAKLVGSLVGVYAQGQGGGVREGEGGGGGGGAAALLAGASRTCICGASCIGSFCQQLLCRPNNPATAVALHA